MEKKIFWGVDWDTNPEHTQYISDHESLVDTLATVAQEIVNTLDATDPDEWNAVSITIEPVLMTQEEFDNLSEF